MLDRKSLSLGLAAALMASVCNSAPAHAETLAFSCGFTSAQIAEYNQASALGITVPDLGQRFAFSVDTGTRTVVVSGPPSATYSAQITDSTVSWSTPPDEDGDSASFSFAVSSSVLTTVDPGGAATHWDCTKR